MFSSTMLYDMKYHSIVLACALGCARVHAPAARCAAGGCNAMPVPSELGGGRAVSRGLYRNVSFDLMSCRCLIVYELDVRAVHTYQGTAE